jgi:hypothetical protein
MLPLAGLSLGGLFRLDPAGPTTLDAIAILHITDVHADPLYDVSWYGCGHKGCTRNLTWQDAKGKPTKNLCSSSGKTERVAGQCGPWDGSHESMAKFWKEMIQPGPMCPCGVAFSNPPYSVIPPLRAALEEFAQDGFASQAAIYTGDVLPLCGSNRTPQTSSAQLLLTRRSGAVPAQLAGHFMPGTSEQLEAAGCTTAKAVMKSTIEMLSVEGVGRPIWGSNPRRGDEARCIGSHLACIGRHGCRDRALLRPRQQRRHPEEQAAERGVAARARRLPAGTAAGCERASTPLPDPAPTRPRRACAPNWSRLRPLGAALAHRGGARAVGRRGLLLAENAHDGALQRRLGRQARPPRERNGVPSASKGRFEAQAAPPWPGSPPEQLGGSPWPQEPASASGARRGPPRS